jgi:L-alanine-DL-glutamate epimerase-like enolase superfamily enzyme
MSQPAIIDRVQVHWGEIPVKLTFSYGKVNVFPFIIVRLFAGKCEGLGEVVVPTKDFLFELLPRLLGADARKLDALLPETHDDHDRILCEAVSIALWDLLGHVCGLPLWSLLGGAPGVRVPLMPCTFPNTPAEARERAEFFFAQGYTYLKVKLIGDLEEDVARVRAIRSVAPAGAVLQGDANCAYKTIEAARRALRQTGDAGLDIFEDPLEGGPEDYAQLRNAGARVMIDALSRRTADLVKCLRLGAAEVVGIHPDQPGSLTKVREHILLAQAFGVPVVMGGTGYTGVGTAAYQHLTAALTPGGPCGELGGAFDHGMPKGIVKKPLPMAAGYVTLPDTPGMGVDVDEEALAEFGHGQQEWRR